MEKFIQFWDNITSFQRILTVLTPLLFFFLLENIIPLFRFTYNRFRHAASNLFFLSMTLIINLMFGLLTISVSIWTINNGWGLFQLVDIPLWSKLVFTLIIMDFFSQYAPHYMLHKVKLFWRFHVVHHSDTHVDVTTGTRHHPGEWVLRESCSIIGVFLIGIGPGLYFLHRSFQALFTYFNHANIQLPKWLDRSLALVFVTPDMHKFHHHHKRPWTDMNYANSFSLWDRLFGTLVYDDTKKITYGIDTLDGKHANNVGYQLKIPFDKNIQVTRPEFE